MTENKANRPTTPEQREALAKWMVHIQTCEKCQEYPRKVGSLKGSKQMNTFDGMKEMIHSWIDTMCVDGQVEASKAFVFYFEEK